MTSYLAVSVYRHYASGGYSICEREAKLTKPPFVSPFYSSFPPNFPPCYLSSSLPLLSLPCREEAP